MPVHAERRVMPWSPAQLYALVADIARYPEFLPWCIAARIHRREPVATGEIVWADLVVGFRMVREKFTSKVTLTPLRPDGVPHIDVEYVDGPLRHLKNHWLFVPLPDGSTEIDFHVEFEFRSKILEKLIGALFHEAITRMVGAFERRALALYGAPGRAAARQEP